MKVKTTIVYFLCVGLCSLFAFMPKHADRTDYSEGPKSILSITNDTCKSDTIFWQNTIGGSGDDLFNDMIQTSDGGFIAIGTSDSDSTGDKSANSRGGKDYWVVKMDSVGIVQWDSTYGGNNADYGQDIEQTFDGGYIVGGHSTSDSSGDKTENSNGSGFQDFWILKLDASGSIEWQNTIGGNGHDNLRTIIQTPDSGFIAAGTSSSGMFYDKTESSYGSFDYWVLKLDQSGSIMWQRTLGGADYDVLYDVIALSDTSFILAGSSKSGIGGLKDESSRGDYDFWVIALDTNSIQWQKTIGGDAKDELFNVELISDGSILVGGLSLSGISGDKTMVSRGSTDCWLLKLNSLGDIVWQKAYGGSSSDYLSTNSFIETTNGDFILNASSYSPISGDKTHYSYGSSDYWLIKIDTVGDIIWQKTIGGNNQDLANAVIQTGKGNFVLAGSSSSNAGPIKSEDSQGFRDYWILEVSKIVLKYYEDLDNDGYGGDYVGCAEIIPSMYVDNNLDCNDMDSLFNPEAIELCDGIDQNCDGIFEVDSDSDGLLDCEDFCASNPEGSILWQKTIGGSSKDEDPVFLETSDHGFIVGGTSSSSSSGDKDTNGWGSTDYWIVKLDSNKSISWQITLGGTSSDVLSTVIQTSDGGYLIGGYSGSDSTGNKTSATFGLYDYWIVKLDAVGSVQWQKTYGGNKSDLLSSMAQTTNGFILGGSSYSGISGNKTTDLIGSVHIWIIEIDMLGNILWQKSVGGNSSDNCDDLLVDDNKIIVGGTSRSGISGDKSEPSRGYSDYWVVCLDLNGNVLWDKTLGGNSNDILSGLSRAYDGGYVIGGSSYSGISGEKTEPSFGSLDYWIVKLDSQGVVQWDKTLGGSNVDDLSDVVCSDDDGFVVGGRSNSPISGIKTVFELGSMHYWIVKLDKLGIIQWQYALGGVGFDNLTAVSKFTDGTYGLSGYSDSNISGDKSEDSRGQTDYWIINIPEMETTYYSDVDGDGYGADSVGLSCGIPAGFAGNNLDCNDTDTLITAVCNDYICTATELFCEDTISDNTAIAHEYHDKLPTDPNCGGGSLRSPNLFYKFTGTGERMTASLCGSPLDTRLDVLCLLNGDCAGTPEFVCLAGNDDFCALQSQVTFPTEIGAEYYFMVHAFGQNATGGFQLTLSCETDTCSLIANDDCTTSIGCRSIGSALQISVQALGVYAPTFADNSCANLFPGANPSCNPYGQIYDLWYKFEVPASGQILFTKEEISMLDNNVALAVYESCDSVPMICYSGFNLSSDTVVLSGLLSGDTMLIQLWSDGRVTQGNFEFSLQDLDCSESTNSSCGSADRLSVQDMGTYRPDTISINCATLNVNNTSCTPAGNIYSQWFWVPVYSSQMMINLEALSGPANSLNMSLHLNCDSSEIYCIDASALANPEAVFLSELPDVDSLFIQLYTTGRLFGEYLINIQTAACMEVNDSVILYESTDVPVIIPLNDTTVASTLMVDTSITELLDVNVIDLDISHTWVSDINVMLTSPEGTTVTLLTQTCPGINQDIYLSLDDGASNTSIPCPPVDSNTYKSSNLLSAFIGENPNGLWTLEVKNIFGYDGGSINGWGLDFVGGTCGSNCMDTIIVDFEFGFGSINQTIQCVGPGDTITISDCLAGDTILIIQDSIAIDQDLTIIADPADNIWIDASAVNTFLFVNPGVTLWLEGVNIIAPAAAPGKVICFNGNVTLKDVNIYEPDGSSNGILLGGTGTLTILGDSNIIHDD